VRHAVPRRWAQTFAHALFQRLGLHSSSPPRSPAQAAAQPSGATQGPAAGSRHADPRLLTLPVAVVHAHVWSLLDNPTRVALLSTSFTLARMFMARTTWLAIAAASMQHEASAPKREAALLAVASLAPPDPCGDGAAARSLGPLLGILLLLRHAPDQTCDVALALFMMPRLAAMKLDLICAIAAFEPGAVMPGSDRQMFLDPSISVQVPTVKLIFTSVLPCPVVEHRSLFSLRALLSDGRSIAQVCQWRAGRRSTSSRVRLMDDLRHPSGRAAITTAGPRTARFLGAVLHGDATHFLISGGSFSQGAIVAPQGRGGGGGG
jgi:hypothetical protein